jgi:hypothetical protein
MVYVDELIDYSDRLSLPPRMRRKWCHLTADTEIELRAFAQRLGLKASWIQYPGTWKVHFDVVESVRAKAVGLGAIEETAREHAARSRSARTSSMASQEQAL